MENSETRMELIERLKQKLDFLLLSEDENKLEIDELIEDITDLQLEEIEERMIEDLELDKY